MLEALLSLPHSFEPVFPPPGPWESPAKTMMMTSNSTGPPPEILQDGSSTIADRSELDRTTEDERTLRRKISNRESARRSRKRKQEHLDDLRAEIDRIKSENRALSDRLSLLNHSCGLFRTDNDRFRLECASLRLRLRDLKSVLLLQKKLQSASDVGYFHAVGNGQTLIT